MTSADRRTSALPDPSQKASFVREMFDAIAPRYDLVNKVMTFGLDAGWRSRAITLLGLQPGSCVLDLACGTGDLAAELSRRGFSSVGVDLSMGMLRRTRDREVPLVLCDAGALSLRPAALDGAVSGFALRNFAALAPVVSELSRVVRPGGRLSLLELAEPQNGLLRAGHSLWFRYGVPVVGALLSDAAAYRYLPESVAYLPTPSELDAVLAGAGFGETRRTLCSGSIVQIVTATRAGGATFARRAR